MMSLELYKYGSPVYPGGDINDIVTERCSNMSRLVSNMKIVIDNCTRRDEKGKLVDLYILLTAAVSKGITIVNQTNPYSVLDIYGYGLENVAGFITANIA